MGEMVVRPEWGTLAMVRACYAELSEGLRGPLAQDRGLGTYVLAGTVGAGAGLCKAVLDTG